MYLCLSVCIYLCVWTSSECIVSQVSAHVYTCVCMYVSVCLDEFRVCCY